MLGIRQDVGVNIGEKGDLIDKEEDDDGDDDDDDDDDDLIE
jgi:hypothetical protein